MPKAIYPGISLMNNEYLFFLLQVKINNGVRTLLIYHKVSIFFNLYCGSQSWLLRDISRDILLFGYEVLPLKDSHGEGLVPSWWIQSLRGDQIMRALA